MGLDQEQLWIGSQDSVIYIINTGSMLCHKQLTEHRREVTDFALEKLSHTPRWVMDSSYVYLAQTQHPGMGQINVALPHCDHIALCFLQKSK